LNKEKDTNPPLLKLANLSDDEVESELSGDSLQLDKN
jgi:hypothetical protein